MIKKTYLTKGNIEVTRRIEYKEQNEIPEIIKSLDNSRGAVFSSNYDYPGRYSRWEIGFMNPGIEIRCYRDYFIIQSTDYHSDLLYSCIREKILKIDSVKVLEDSYTFFKAKLLVSDKIFSEEERSKQTSIFTVLREIYQILYSEEDSILGLYGAFGYDLIFHFERKIELIKERMEGQEELVLYLPDKLFINDKKREEMYVAEYDFSYLGNSTEGIGREEKKDGYKLSKKVISENNYKRGEYADIVNNAIDAFKKGDLFEVVPSHTINKKVGLSYSQIYDNMVRINPSPYNFIINLGNECLIGSSPEMYVRVEKQIVETCPISGTIKRGLDALEDAENIRRLLNSAKDEAELTMCTDVDRNDKSRICIPGSVKIVGRRQIEKYSHLIHTVDHIKGELAEGYDLFDAFLSHMWAVTITGAPKKAAVEWIEHNEQSARVWYGGAIGYIRFNGDMNTGLTLRTVRVCNDMAQIRVGATLLIDSVPEDEETETLTKAAALLESISSKDTIFNGVSSHIQNKMLEGKKVILVDYEDSFVHTLANYIRQMGAMVKVVRYNYFLDFIDSDKYDVVMLSPGPGMPMQFGMEKVIEFCVERNIPILGICLGFQGIAEYYGGRLAVLEKPRHGVVRRVTFVDDFIECDSVEVGLYHSIFVSNVSQDFEVIAKDEENIIMGIKHKEKPIVGLQFHPESILSQKQDIGKKILKSVFDILV